MKKTRITANQLYKHSFALAKNIYSSGFVPDYLLIIMRGGAPTGIIVHEYYKCRGKEIKHKEIKAVSYTEIGKQQAISFTNQEFLPKTKGKNILIIDDVYDTGKTIKSLIELLKQNKAGNIKTATIYYKPKNNQTRTKPDHYLFETEDWLIFPHELEGVSKTELKKLL